jgi:hypothetical protein
MLCITFSNALHYDFQCFALHDSFACIMFFHVLHYSFSVLHYIFLLLFNDFSALRCRFTLLCKNVLYIKLCKLIKLCFYFCIAVLTMIWCFPDSYPLQRFLGWLSCRSWVLLRGCRHFFNRN